MKTVKHFTKNNTFFSILTLFVLLFFMPGLCFAQFTLQTASNPDIEVNPIFTSLPPANTGIAIAPVDPSGGGDRFVAHVYDDNGAIEHWVKWYNLNGDVLDSMWQDSGDPDDAYLYNIDLMAVISCKKASTELLLDVYMYNSTHTPHYYFRATTSSGPDGFYPNIDINSYGHSVVCYVDSPEVKVILPILNYYSPGFDSPLDVGVGTQPDVVVLDDSTVGVITYIHNGDLIIKEFDYSALVAGYFSVIDSFQYSANGRPYAYPRIAGARNVNFAQTDYYTVVAERDSNTIVAFSYDGNALHGPYTVDSGLIYCPSYRPVVTYSGDKIVFAWAEDYSSCSHSISNPNPMDKDVLLREYDAQNLAIMNSGDLYEVNSTQGTFNNSITALTSVYDGNYPLTSVTDAIEVIAYNNSDSIFWKNRSFGYSYKIASPNMEEPESPKPDSYESFNIQLIENPVSNGKIRLSYKDAFNEIDMNLYNSLGHQVNIENKISILDDEIQVDVDWLKRGVYFIKLIYKDRSKTIKAVIN